jgi:hypothetical protein
VNNQNIKTSTPRSESENYQGEANTTRRVECQ